MPEPNIEKWKLEISRLIHESEEHAQAGDFARASSLLDEVESTIAKVRDGARALKQSGEMTPAQMREFMHHLEYERARKDTRRAMVLQGTGRKEEAKRLLKDMFLRTDLPDVIAFSSMINLATLHASVREKRQAWEAFHQAEKIAQRMGPDESTSRHMEIVRERLRATIGRPPRKRRRWFHRK